MVQIKWRLPDSRFAYWTTVPMSYIKRTTGLIKPYPFSWNQIRFGVINPSDRILPRLENTNQDGNNIQSIAIKMTMFGYYIESGMLYLFDSQVPIALLINENIAHFQVDSNPWQEIKNIHYGFDHFCIVSWEDNAFSMIGGQAAFVDTTDDLEIGLLELKERPLTDLLKQIAVTEFVFK